MAGLELTAERRKRDPRQCARGAVPGRRVLGGAAREAALVRARADRRRARQPAPVAHARVLRAARRRAERCRARAWRDDWERMLARGDQTPAEGMQVVVAGGCDYYPGSATSSPGFSFAVSDLRIAGEGDLLARIDRLRKQLDAEGLCEPQKLLARTLVPRVDRRDHRRAGQGARRRARGARRRGWAGRIVWGFAPVQDRHAAPAIVRALGDLAGSGARRRRDRRARRRLARRPAVLLRRDAVPHGRAARRAGDRVGRVTTPTARCSTTSRRSAARRRRTPPRRPSGSTAGGRAASWQRRPRGCASTATARSERASSFRARRRDCARTAAARC